MTRVLIVCAVWFLCFAPAWAQSTPAATPAAEKTAGETMKNVLVLKDVPASEWNDVMSFIDGALGVSCEHCHARAFEADTKKAKLTARNMMKMVRELNAANFEGRPVVTCNTCHQGSLQPKGIPALWNKNAEEIEAFKKQRAADQAGVEPAPPAPASSAESLPSVAQVFANYRKAVGSGPAKSLHMKVALSGDTQPVLSADFDIVYPDKLSMHIVRTDGVELRMIINGEQGWQLTPQGTRELPQANVQTAKKNFGDLFQVIKYADAEASGKVVGTEKIGDRTFMVVDSSVPKGKERLYFDAQTGLLHKVHSETRAANFGISPTEIWFDDYRESNGAQVPFSITISSVSDRVRLKLADMQTNQSMEAARFEPPAPPAAPAK